MVDPERAIPYNRSIMKIFLSADLHANILAAEAAVRAARDAGADLHIHLGDAVDLGPWPDETVHFLRDSGVLLLMGNHEEYHIETGFSPRIKARMDLGEQAHYAWTTSQLSSEALDIIRGMPYEYAVEEGDNRYRFCHFAVRDDRIAEDWGENDVETFIPLFGAESRDVVFYGHLHRYLDFGTRPRFVCIAGSGVSPGRHGDPKSAAILDIDPHGYSFTRVYLDWNLDVVRRQIESVNDENREWVLEHMFAEPEPDPVG